MSTRSTWRIADRVDVERLRKVILDGATPEQVSARFGIAIGTARNWCFKVRKQARAGQ